MNPGLEIRKLPIGARLELSSMLEVNNSWKLLMGAIPKCTGHVETQKYSSEDVTLIETEAKRQSKPAFEILIEEWGTSGKERPTVQQLIQLLVKLELYRAADFLSKNLLGNGPLERPANGPSATVSSYVAGISFAQTNRFDSIGQTVFEATNEHVNRRLLQEKGVSSHTTIEDFNTSLPHLSYSDLEYLTNDFDESPVFEGRKLGAGAYGTVFLGMLEDKHRLHDKGIQIYQKMKLPVQSKVAVKRLHSHKADTCLFRTEVETMSQYAHENLLALLAYSADGPDCCLVYTFIPNGSLEARLACEGGTSPLQWNQRLDVAQDVAKALIYLHTGRPQSLVHRDVKSANILLDHDMKAKLGDFGLIRIGANARSSKSMALTSNPLGTPAYTAPEGHRGDISVKLDTFSFGVVILELLTGLPSYDEERDGNDLVSECQKKKEGRIENYFVNFDRRVLLFVEHLALPCDLHFLMKCETTMNISHIDSLDLEAKNFIQLLDPRISPLPENMASALHCIAISCIQEKKKRPFMTEVYSQLLQIDQSDLITL